MLENVRLAFQGIWAHKMRSFLTMLGIIIGIASIISIVSTIKGTNDQIKKNLIGSGKNTVKVRLSEGGYEWTPDYGEIPAGLIPVPDKALEAVAELDGADGVTAYNSRYMSDGIYYNDKSVSSLYLYGIDDSYMKVAGFKVKTGRPFMQSDYEKFRTVMILDGAASRTLFGEENPIGKEVEIKGTPFTVIGIAEDTNTFEPNIETVEDYYTYKQETNGVAYVPKAAWTIIYGYDEPENVIVKARTTDDMTKIGKKTADILNEYVSVKDGAIKYAAEDLLGQASQMQQLNSASSRQLIWIAGISLLVGGIGVMNIMLVSVTERTPEIGLKKAIGAKKGAILWQFLTEAGVLTSIGGILGVVAGIGAAYVIKRINGTPAAIDVGYSLLAVGFSMLIGLLFGFLPSVQAANLDPIVALRRE